MPRVETYGPRKVRTAPLPDTQRRGPAGVAETFESLGGTVGQAQAGFGDQVAKTGLAFLQQQQQRDAVVQQRRSELELLTGDRQLGDAQLELKMSALSVRGMDAVDNVEPTLAEFDRRAGAIEAGAKTDKGRDAIRRANANRRESLAGDLSFHAMRQVDAAEASETEASLTTSVNTAIASATEPDAPWRISQELDRQRAVITQHGPRLGLGPQAQQAAIAKHASDTHLGVIDQLLSAEQEGRASAYYDEVKDQIAGDKQAAVVKALDVGTLRGNSQRQADAIIAAGGSVSEQRAKVRAIDDPKVRDAVEARVEHEADVQKNVDRGAHDALLLRASQVVIKTGRVDKISPADVAQMSVQELSAFRSYAKQLTEKGGVETNWATYYRVMQMASTEPEAFLNENLYKYRGELGDTEWKHAIEVQGSIRKGNTTEAAAALDSFRTTAQIVDGTLQQAKVDISTSADNPDLPRAVQFRRTVDERLQALARLTGKKTTSADVQQISDDLITSVTLTKAAWWNPFSSDVSKRKFEITAADIPFADRAQLAAALRAKQRPVTDAAILTLYLAHQAAAGGK